MSAARADGEPGRSTEFIRAVEWLGATWRIGIAVDERGLAWRLTFDADSEAAIDAGDAEALAMMRGAFTLLSDRLPLSSAALDRLADEVAGPAEFALRAAADIQRHEGAEWRRVCRHLRDQAAAPEARA